jgi:hypothetical protein
MKKLIAATLFCATIAIPAVAQGPHPVLAMNGAPSPSMGAHAANMVPVSGAVAAPVAGTSGLYGGDMATRTPSGPGLGLPSGPAPSIAWILALGFLGLVVLRRTRSSNGF